MKLKTILSLLAIAPVPVGGANAQNQRTNEVQTNFFSLLCCSNRIYTNATIESVTPATATIFWDGGGERIAITNLPPEVQTRYGYDPEEAQKYLKTQGAKKAAIHEQEGQALAAIAIAKQTLGPAHKIRIVKILRNAHLQIEVDGVLAEAYIHNLPPRSSPYCPTLKLPRPMWPALKTRPPNSSALPAQVMFTGIPATKS